MVLSGYAQQKAEQLFQSGLYKEEVQGDLDSAIQIYENLIKDFPHNQSIAAKAQLHIGLCYEKEGKQKARKAYQAVIDKYPSQLEAVRLALEGLSRLSESEGAKRDEHSGVSLKEVKIDASESRFALSPDGNKIAYSNMNRNLAILDLRSGEEKQLTNLKKGEGGAWWPVWSPDGKSIVYQHHHNYWKYEMEIVAVETGKVRHTEVNGYPTDWSKDGRYILYSEGFIDKATPTVNLMPVKGGPIKRLDITSKSLNRLSPDGKYIVYEAKENNNQDIYVLPIEGREPIRITNDPATDGEPIWAPDGKLILFKSNRALDQWGFWAVAFEEGKSLGRPFVVKPDISDARVYSWSDDGKLLFSAGYSAYQIYVVSVDPETGSPQGEALKLTSEPKQNWNPAWSPDGKRIAYYSKRRGEEIVCVMSADGSEDREIISLNPYLGPIDWFEDDRIVVIASFYDKGEKGIYSISPSSKDIKPILVDREVLGHPAVSPDGSRIAFLRGLQNFQIYTVDTDGNNLQQLTFDEEAKVYYPTWSPDGRSLAFYKSARGRKSITVVSVDSGEQQELVGSEDPEARFWELNWSPDSKKITYHSKHDIWMISTSGEIEPQRFQVNGPGLLTGGADAIMGTPKWSPDGTKVVFYAGTKLFKIWIMKDFLPKDARAQR